VWPDFSFQEILKIAFRDRIVDRCPRTSTSSICFAWFHWHRGYRSLPILARI